MCWGGFYGPNSSITPTVVAGLEGGVAALAGGEQHICALIAGGDVKCWGLNSRGEIGDGSTAEQHYRTAIWQWRLKRGCLIRGPSETTTAIHKFNFKGRQTVLKSDFLRKLTWLYFARKRPNCGL